MYLSRLTLNRSHIATQWLSNPYRIHQRLKMACEQDPRLLFRVEEAEQGTFILVQSHILPAWKTAFADLPVLLNPPESKSFEINLQIGQQYRFRLLANPTAKKTVMKDDSEKHKLRVGLIRQEDQLAWLKRKLDASGAEVLNCLVIPRGKQYSKKSTHKSEDVQTHLAVLFEGLFVAKDVVLLTKAATDGIGSAKGFGFGLLSLAPASST